MSADVPSQVRDACAWVAGRARSVEIDAAEVEAYAASLPAATELPPPDPATHLVEGNRETRATFVVCLDAINFGSGWWPTIRKRPGHSGYLTIAAGLTERFREDGPWSPSQLTELAATDLAEALDQDVDHPLMEQYATSLRDIGEHVLVDHGGRFEGLVDAADGSAPALAGLLAGWDAFADVSTYDERAVPFFKRAQIAAADLNRTGVAELAGEDQLTAFADNLVPHVLRLDGLLRLSPELERAIEAGELLVHDSPEEVELRACAVHAIEQLSAAMDARLSPSQVDAALWNRGRGERYKSVPRPRSRNTAY